MRYIGLVFISMVCLISSEDILSKDRANFVHNKAIRAIENRDLVALESQVSVIFRSPKQISYQEFFELIEGCVVTGKTPPLGGSGSWLLCPNRKPKTKCYTSDLELTFVYDRNDKVHMSVDDVSSKKCSLVPVIPRGENNG